MIAGNGEDGILIPRLLTGYLEEMLKSHICIPYDFIDGHIRILLLEYIFISIRHTERMMARQREESCHEGLLHLSHLLTHILHKWLVADAPPAIKIVITSCTRICHKVLTTIILLELGGSCKGHKAHRTTLSTMEEGCLVTLPIQAISQS